MDLRQQPQFKSLSGCSQRGKKMAIAALEQLKKNGHALPTSGKDFFSGVDLLKMTVPHLFKNPSIDKSRSGLISPMYYLLKAVSSADEIKGDKMQSSKDHSISDESIQKTSNASFGEFSSSSATVRLLCI